MQSVILHEGVSNCGVLKDSLHRKCLAAFVSDPSRNVQGVMQQMPPLPVRLNVELANNFLPKAVANGVCQMPYMAAPMHGESFPTRVCKDTHLKADRLHLLSGMNIDSDDVLRSSGRSVHACGGGAASGMCAHLSGCPAGMPQMPAMSQQGSGAGQASAPYPAASLAAPGIVTPALAQQPGMNGITAPATMAAVSPGLPAAGSTMPAAVPASMAAVSSIPAALAANSLAQSHAQAPADKQVASSQAPLVHASTSAPFVKLEPGMSAPGSLPMPGGSAASPAPTRPSPPVKFEYQPPSSAAVGAAAPVQGGNMLPGSTMLHSSTAPVASPAVSPQPPQQQQAQQRAPVISMSLPDPTKAPLDVLFPASLAAQQAAVHDPTTSAGGLYDVLASITAHAPGMLQPAMPQPFSAPQPASAGPAAAAQGVPQPRASPAAHAAGMQQILGSNAPASASGPHPVIQKPCPSAWSGTHPPR